MVEVSQIKKKPIFLLHTAIVFILAFGFGALPPFGLVTPLGMKVIGIFLGLLYGWSTINIIWPSLLGMVALVLTGLFTMPEMYAASFGNDTIVMMLICMVFIAAIDHGGVMTFVANWLVSRKSLEKKPWLFTFVFLFSCYFCSVLTSPLPTVLIFWSIIYKIAHIFGYKPYEKWPTLMVIGVLFASTCGWAAFPFKILVLIILGAYKNITGISVDFLDYTLFAVPLGIVCVLGYGLLCRFVFRVDISKLKNISSEIVDAKDLVLNSKQKILLGSLFLWVFILLAPSVLPEAWALSQLFKTIGGSGATILLVVALMIIRVDDVPVVDFSDLARKGIFWDTLLITCVILPMSTAITAEGTGIKEAIVAGLKPVLMGQSQFMFMLLVVVISVILTNVSNNAVVGVIFVSLTCAFAVPLGLNATPIVVLACVCAHMAMITPVASPIAAMLHGNKDWAKNRDIYLYSTVTIAMAIVVLIAVGIPWANFIFPV